jgi:hypothetical protein
MFFTLTVTNTDAFFALEEALDQCVMNNEDMEDEWHEDITSANEVKAEAARKHLRRLDEARTMLNKMTAVLCSLADGPS